MLSSRTLHNVVAIVSFAIGLVIGMCIDPFDKISEDSLPETSIVSVTSVTTEWTEPQTEEIKTQVITTTTDTEETTTESTVEETTTLTTITTLKTTVSTEAPSEVSKEKRYLGTFKGTYYAGKSVPCKGGSGRTLIDCTVGGNGVKGSVASRYAYEKWGYKANGGRTKLYLEIKGHESMNGWYYVDDCNAVSSIIDFYFYKNSNCPWQKTGVVEVKCYG